MGSSYQFIIAIVLALVIQYLIVCTNAQDNDWESPVAKRKRLSIERLRELGRLRRLIKRGGYSDDNNDLQNDDIKRLYVANGPYSGIEYPPLQVLQDLEDLEEAGISPDDFFEIDSEEFNKRKTEKAARSPARERGGWYTGLMGKRPASRQARAASHQAFMSGDYFGKRVTREGEHAGVAWKQVAYNLDDNTDVEAQKEQ